MEMDVVQVPWTNDLITNPPVIEDGHMKLPEGSGMGRRIDEATLVAHPPIAEKY